jgi:hypothetical protein
MVMETPEKAPANGHATPGCTTCGGETQEANGRSAAPTPKPAENTTYVFALGRIEARFPNLSVEKEFAQAVASFGAKGLTDRQLFHAVLSAPQNRYLARQLCWAFSVGGLDAYVLINRDPADLDLLLESLRSNPGPTDIDVIIGMVGPAAPAHLCNGLSVPIVITGQIYSFDRAALLKSLPRPDDIPADHFEAASQEIFDRIAHMADNTGATDEQRALNYLAVRYPGMYSYGATQYRQNLSLSAIDVRPTRGNGYRKMVDVVFSFTSRLNGISEKAYVRVDVTEQFPFLCSKLMPFYEKAATGIAN